MLELVFTVCSIVHGAYCHLESLPLQTGTSLVGCMMASQIEGAKWVQHNPNYYIQRATCQRANRFAKT
jgi:hypothetical protein